MTEMQMKILFWGWTSRLSLKRLRDQNIFKTGFHSSKTFGREQTCEKNTSTFLLKGQLWLKLSRILNFSLEWQNCLMTAIFMSMFTDCYSTLKRLTIKRKISVVTDLAWLIYCHTQPQLSLSVMIVLLLPCSAQTVK